MDRQSLILKVFIIVTIAIAITYIGYQSGDDSKGRHPEEEMEVSIEPGIITICSFNIQFLGPHRKKDDKTFANFLKEYDLVVIQELAAPLEDGIHPDAETYSAMYR